ncbi:MAG: GAF domain-containing protein [Anaerolineales bacterium]|nr:GAF domain-containing protein [Anaerolineales bacterium]
MSNSNSSGDAMQNRINNMFSNQELPTYIGLRQVEEMKAHIQELEAKVLALSTPPAVHDATIPPELGKPSSATTGFLPVPEEQTEPMSPGETNQKSASLIRRILTAPTFGNLAVDRIASLQHKILLGLITTGVIGIIVLIATWNASPTAPSALAILLFDLSLLTATFFLQRQGRIQLVSWMLVGIIYLVTLLSMTTGSFSVTAVLQIALVVTLAGLLLKPTQVVLATAISIITIILGPIFDPATDINQVSVVFTAIILGLDGLLLTIASSTLDQSFSEVDRSTSSLTNANKELQDLTQGLEQRVADRTHDIELASEVGRIVTARVDNLPVLLSESVELIRTRFNLYYTQVYLTDPSGRTITLRAGTGEAGKQLVSRGHHLLIGMTSLNGRAAFQKKTVLVSNTAEDPGFLPNPLLPRTRSEMAVPLIANDQVVGVLDMQGEEVNSLNKENQAAFEALAGQLAVAIQNASLFEQVLQSRREAEGRATQQAHSNWLSFLDAIDRNEKIGYAFNQSEVLPIEVLGGELDQKNALHTPLTVAGAAIGGIQISDDPGRKWTPVETEIINETAQQLSRHIENLRLLAQSDKYRLEAEEISKRLTREGWTNYLNTRENLVEGYLYAENKVQILTDAKKQNVKETQSYPIYVRDEMIGELAVDSEGHDQQSVNELIASVSQQLSSHIENLRLLEETQAQRGQLSDALTAAKLANWEFDFDRGVFIFNDNFYQIFHTTVKQEGGYELSAEEYAKRFVHPADAALVDIEIGKAIASTARVYEANLEHRFKYADGSGIGYMSVAVHLEKDENGKILRWTGANQDITERKSGEAALAKRAEQLVTLNRVMEVANSSLDLQYILQTATDEFRVLMQAFSAGVLMLDEKGEALTLTTESYGEPNMPKLVGRVMPIAANPATDKSIKSGNTVLVPNAQTDPILAPIHAIMKQRNIQSVLVTPLFSRNKIIGVFSVDTNDPERHFDDNDITLIETLAKQLASAIESIQLFDEARRRAADLSTVAAVSTATSTMLDPDQLLQTVVNITKERFNLYHAHVYLSTDSWDMLLLAAGSGEVGRKMVETSHAIPISTERSLVARAARERQTVVINNVQEEEGFLPNALLPDTRAEMAVPMIVGENVLGVFDVQSDKPSGFSAEDADIYTTLAAQVAVALQNARLYVEQAATVTQLRELDKLKSSFLANMSHELRTPLNSILGFTDVMLEELDGPLTPNMDNDLKLIQKNGKHLLHLINDVLDMAKIESGKMNLIIEKFNLNDTIEDVMNITSSLANEKSISLFIEPESDKNLFIRADHTRLRQVLINLMNNGIKFTEKGSVSVCIKHQDNDVLIAVKDTGMGIPPDHLDSIFQEFTQVDSTTTRKAGGTGLGLPISRRLIEMHGGKLWAESSGKNGKGSIFNILLPIEAVVSEAIVSEPLEKR